MVSFTIFTVSELKILDTTLYVCSDTEYSSSSSSVSAATLVGFDLLKYR